MALGGDNAWSNFSYGSRIDTPNGCLLNPEGSRLIFFERCKNHHRTASKSLHILFTRIIQESQQGLNLQAKSE